MFYKATEKKDGLFYACKVCCKEIAIENKEKISERHKKYYEKNKESIKNRVKEYTKNNKNKKIERDKKYYEKNKKRISDYRKKYVNDNKDYIRDRQKKYRDDNKELIRENKKKYDKENRAYINNRSNNNTKKLNDSYVKARLKKNLNITIEQITPELIEIQRTILKIKRKANETSK